MADTGGTPSCHNPNPEVLNVLEALKKASHELQAHPHVTGSSAESDHPDSSSSIKALLELQTESDALLSSDPYLCNLSNHLSTLKSLVQKLRGSKGYSLRSFLTRHASAHSISRVAESIGSEIQAWIDREIVEELMNRLKELNGGGDDEEEVIRLLGRFEKRVSQGFDRELQDLVLKSKLLVRLEESLGNPKWSTRLREHAAFVIAALMKFNKDVFVGLVPLGQTIRALITIASVDSLKVLILLIRSIKSAIVDEIESNGEIPKIIGFLDCKDLQFRLVAMDSILEMGYFGRKEAIEAMLNAGLIEKLMELQRSSLGGALIDSSRYNNDLGHETEDNNIGEGRRSRERKFLDCHPFASCVARFAVQLEVGEGLRQRERRAFKQEVLERVREASDTDAEAATVIAEVLWGSSP
ncbi:hypothetical protein MLD38_006658 [Melastoma candidum]|uniref:Uncharacterized protein n=1 Tax=Melastoma candidum TaxID=119954 RepID=A0ACB9RNB2_9MYRT|nr:hypothetical protein MLD38_006658 [Melastoma candidum]